MGNLCRTWFAPRHGLGAVQPRGPLAVPDQVPLPISPQTAEGFPEVSAPHQFSPPSCTGIHRPPSYGYSRK